MNLLEIYIENKKLDVSSDLSSLLTFAIDDIKDFSARNTTFSKTIILPGTANNNKLFGQIFDARVSNPFDEDQDNVDTNFNAATSANCIMFQNHIQVFKGVLRVLEIVITDGTPEYEVAVFGELGGLVASLGINKLTDLDFSAYDHILNAENVSGSWNVSGGSGYYYPLIDVGGVSVAKVDYDIQAFRPALYVKEYIDKIFTAAGYRYSSALMDTERFRRLIIPCVDKTLRSSATSLLTATRTTRYEVVNNSSPVDANLKFETFDGAGFSANVDKDEFTYTDADPLNCTVSFRIAGDCDVIAIAGGIDLHFQINGSTIPGYSKQLLVDGNYVWEFTFDITLNNGDVITFLYDGNTILAVNNEAFATTCTFSITSLVPIYAPAGVGDTIEMNTTIPKNILQKDFLSSVIRLFNLYLYEDPNQSKMVYLTPYIDFYNVSGAIDWDYKMDRSRSVRLKPMSELNARYYNFRFRQDSDFYNEQYRKRYNETYGDYIFDSQYEFADEKKDIELIFSPTVLVGYTGVDKIVSVFYKKNAGVEEKTDVNIRILQSKRITGVASWSILDGVSTLASGLTEYGYAGHYDDPDAPANDIHFGVPKELFFTIVSGAINITQFNVYWSSYMAEITDKDSKLLTGYFKLNNADIYGLDFARFIHLDGSYWRLNKITDWNASEPDVCQVELLKLIYIFY